MFLIYISFSFSIFISFLFLIFFLNPKFTDRTLTIMNQRNPKLKIETQNSQIYKKTLSDLLLKSKANPHLMFDTVKDFKKKILQNYETTEHIIKREFEAYGPIKRICDMVAVARIINATLVVPEPDKLWDKLCWGVRGGVSEMGEVVASSSCSGGLLLSAGEVSFTLDIYQDGYLIRKPTEDSVQVSRSSLRLYDKTVTDNYFDSLGTVTYWWSHSMISDHTYQSIISGCNFTIIDNSPSYDAAISYAMNHAFGYIDHYSIYTPACRDVLTTSNYTTQNVRFKNTLLRRRVNGYDPCTENYAESYYNRPEVQKAMHANSTGIPYKWTACSDLLIKNWKDSQLSMLPIYKELIVVGLRIWVFSGDTDSVVPVTATRFSLNHLNLTIKTRWYPWYSSGQIGE